MKILVTGASGFLGQSTVESLLDHGHQVKAMVRSSSAPSAWPNTVEIVEADLRMQSQYEEALKNVDAVVHIAAAVSGNEDQQFSSTVIATEILLNTLTKSDVKKFILISTISIYDWSKIKKEMNEDSPLSSYIYDMGAYSIAKFWQEKIVKEAAAADDLQLTVLRPGFIWGEEHAKIAGMGRSVGPFHLMFGPFSHLPLTHVDNCADCIAKSLSASPSLATDYNLFDGHNIRVWQYCRAYFKRSGQRKILIPVPYYFGLAVAHLAKLTSRLLFGPSGRLPSLLDPKKYEAQFKPLRYSTQKLQNDLNWRPPFDFQTALKKSFK